MLNVCLDGNCYCGPVFLFALWLSLFFFSFSYSCLFQVHIQLYVLYCAMRTLPALTISSLVFTLSGGSYLSHVVFSTKPFNCLYSPGSAFVPSVLYFSSSYSDDCVFYIFQLLLIFLFYLCIRVCLSLFSTA